MTANIPSPPAQDSQPRKTPGDWPPPGDRMMAVLAMPGLSWREKAVLAAIAWHDGRGPRGTCPSDDLLARELGGIARPAVWEVRDALRRKGRLSWKHGRTTNRYTVHYDCQGKPDSEMPGQCQEKPNSVSVSGFDLSQCQDSTDTNQKEPEGLSETGRLLLTEDKTYACTGCGLTGIPPAAWVCPQCGCEAQRCPACNAVGVDYSHARECPGPGGAA